MEREGRRSSSRAAASILADAVRSVDESLARRIEGSKNWRKAYMVPFGEVVAAGARSGKDALRIAADGLESARRNLCFVTGAGESSLGDALAGPAGSFRTEVVEGSGGRLTELVVPYRGQSLSGAALIAQIDRWEQRGVLEPSCALALQSVVEHSEWLDLSDDHFALLGAASEMGPLEALAAWGANVIAVDLPQPRLWSHIVGTARRGSGRLYAPVTGDGGELDTRAGADLLTQLPEVHAWLNEVDKPFTLGNYVYADGANFLRLQAGVDALVESFLTRRSDVSLAYLATPTDVFAVPEQIADAAARGRARKSPARTVFHAVTGGRLYSPNYDRLVEGEEGRRWGISNALVPIQGPNYALAKSLQRWRAMLAREEGTLSSATLAPASRTRSVVKNKMLAAAYRGAPAYGLEIFKPETARWLTAALLVHDLRNPSAAARPETQLAHPFDLFVDGALHGGMWRLAYEARSVLPLALARGLVKRRG